MQILAPVVRRKKGEHQKVFESARKSGYVRVRVDGIIYDLSEEIELEKQKKHNIEIVVDRLVVKDGIRTRLADSVEIALHQAEGIVMILNGEEELTFSRNYACEDCGISLEELSPRMFSFNNPMGACPRCSGIGLLKRVDPSLVLISDELSIMEGAFSVSGWRAPDKDGSMANATFRGLAKKYDFSLNTPVKNLPQEVVDIILYGTKGEEIEIEHMGKRGLSKYMTPFEGIVTNLQRRYDETDSEWSKWDIEGLMREIPCNECKGKRLRRESLAVTVDGKRGLVYTGNENLDGDNNGFPA